ncbi:MAG: tyrosine-type recombinase/integrase [Candidatus Obscuribacterales bacterium]
MDLRLRAVFQDYTVARCLKQKTLNNYRHRLRHCFQDWLDLDIREISREMVMQRHKEIQGNAMANSAMRTLKAIYNFAMTRYEVDDEPVVQMNPTLRLTVVKGWYRDRRRKSVLQVADLRPWWQAVYHLDNTSVRDLFITLLLTGMRRGEATNLVWSDVDFDEGTIHLTETKTESRIVPVSNFVLQLLQERFNGADSSFVFESKAGTPLSPAFVDMALKQVIRETGKKWMLHDLRRTYITLGDYLEEKLEVVQALVGHRGCGMTERYVIRSVERLRRTTQNITDAVLEVVDRPCGIDWGQEPFDVTVWEENDGEFDSEFRKLPQVETTSGNRQARIHTRHLQTSRVAQSRD